MKLRFVASILMFLSAYSPLAIIFLIQDYDVKTGGLAHPRIAWTILTIAIVSCFMVWLAVARVKVSSPPVTVLSVSNRSGELVNYSLPYMVSFFLSNLGDPKQALCFSLFMILMFWLTVKTHNLYINPILAIFGYNLYEVCYERNGKEQENSLLIKGERPQKGETCRIVEVSEQLFLVTERNPKV